MKTTLFIAVLFLSTIASAQREKQLTILHTNDTHSCIYPLHPHLADTALAGRGGYVRRIELIRQERSQNPDLLLLDSGDFSQGSPYYTFYKGDVEIELMNQMRYDASTIGNHEFDYGLDNMARIFRKAKFPILCSNYDFRDTPVEGTVKRWTVIRRNGIRIGLFALCPQMDGLIDQTKCQGVTFLDPVSVATEMASFLKTKKRCHLVVCISHLGWDTPGVNDQVVMSQTRNIDLFLGGHSHTYMEQLRYTNNLDNHPTPNDQNGKHGIWIGKINIEMKKK